MLLWSALLCCVVIGSLLPAASPVMVGIGRLHVSDKLLHFGAYLALSALPVLGIRDRRTGTLAGLSMFLLGLLLEAAQHYSPGRAVEFGDVIANGAGVSCGVLFAFPLRILLALI
jgi:VanZ family protein